MKFIKIAGCAMFVVLSSCGDAGSESAVLGNLTAKNGAAEALPDFRVGDPVNFDAFEITVKSVEQAQSVGGSIDTTKASDGGTLVSVTYTLKNTGKKPLSMFDRPSLQLIDPEGQQYSSDVGATSSLRMQKDFTAKVMSDLNPGITTTDGAVFEVSKDKFDKATWKVVLEGHESSPISLK